MNEQRSVLRSIAWLDLCPWLMLFRCPGIAIRLEIIFLATLGGVLTSFAWGLSGLLFFPYGMSLSEVSSALPAAGDEQEAIRAAEAVRFSRLLNHLSSLPGAPLASQRRNAAAYASPEAALPFGSFAWRALTGQMDEPLFATWRRLVGPYLQLFRLHLDVRQFAYLLLGGLLTLLIWSVFGGAITRCTAMQLGRDERIGLRQALRFSVRKLLSYFTAPLYPLLGIALFAAGVFLFVGLPMNLDVGLIWAGIVWTVVLVFGYLVAILALGLLFGWPLMWTTISTEGSDAFDALSRTYAYTLQRPLHYLFYAVVVGVLGALTWLLVLQMGEAVIHLSWWAADWGVFNEQRMDQLIAAANGTDNQWEQLQPTAKVGVWLLGLGNGIVRAATFSFAYGYLWVSASAMYLLLRREVDHTETDEVYLDDEVDDYGLPPLEDDERGVPGVPEKSAEKPAAEADESAPAAPPPDEGEERGKGSTEG